MCGIVGIIGPSRPQEAQHMLARLRHRGTQPPRSRAFADIGTVGHVRLPIIDVDGGSQPLVNDELGIAVVGMGEIYNHQAIRRRLADEYKFMTGVDTEAIIPLYRRYGDEAVEHLDGQFAFILFDLHHRRTLMARDPFGIRPLYYANKGKTVYAAAELKAFLDLDVGNIAELPPGHYWTTDKGLVRYHQTRSDETEPDLDRCRDLLTTAVRKRLMSDVPVGTFLSGGVDSSIVTALAAAERPDVVAFTVGMDGAPDLDMARRVAASLGVRHVVRSFDDRELFDLLPDVIYHLESYNPSLITCGVATWLCARLAAAHGVRVVLCGEGADELFAGYPPIRHLTGDALKHTQQQLLRSLYRTELKRLDRMGLATAVEARVPFLDTEVVDYALNLPADEKIRERGGRRVEKWHLRKAFEGCLPDEVLWREKMPFDRGAGSLAIVEQAMQAATSLAQRRPDDLEVWGVESREMSWYFDLWARHFGALLDPHQGYRLCADYPVLMDAMLARGGALN